MIAARPQQPQGVTERSWRMWESGERPVPEDIAAKIEELCGWREDAIETASERIDMLAEEFGEEPERIAICYYQTAGDWISLGGRDPVLWRPHCAVVAELCARHGAIAIPFDRAAYDRWRGEREDSESLRGEWAEEAAVLRATDRTMPTLDWIGKQAVATHHKDVPYRLLEPLCPNQSKTKMP